jgi:hypothetical protein
LLVVPLTHTSDTLQTAVSAGETLHPATKRVRLQGSPHWLGMVSPQGADPHQEHLILALRRVYNSVNPQLSRTRRPSTACRADQATATLQPRRTLGCVCAAAAEQTIPNRPSWVGYRDIEPLQPDTCRRVRRSKVRRQLIWDQAHQLRHRSSRAQGQSFAQQAGPVSRTSTEVYDEKRKQVDPAANVTSTASFNFATSTDVVVSTFAPPTYWAGLSSSGQQESSGYLYAAR